MRILEEFEGLEEAERRVNSHETHDCHLRKRN